MLSLILVLLFYEFFFKKLGPILIFALGPRVSGDGPDYDMVLTGYLRHS